MRVLVTGANGFVGGPVLRALLAAGHEVRAASRESSGRDSNGRPSDAPEWVRTPDLGRGDWRPVLAGCDAVVHLIARVHVVAGPGPDAMAGHLAVNRDATLRLARAAVGRVGRFVYMSTAKVSGESSTRSLTEADVSANLGDPYTLSKYQAEVGLRKLGERLPFVILRPPLVYGPGVKANFRALLRAVERGLPLPFGRVDNRRSLVGVRNLADAVVHALTTSRVLGQTLHVDDGEAISTAELVRRMGAALGRPARLLDVPTAPLMRLAHLVGRDAQIARLIGSLEVDGSRIRATGWSPPLSMAEQLRETVAG